MPLTLVLDSVRSGLNVGSIFRTADAFALEQILLCGITAQPPHREILKTALGSTDSVDWKYYDTSVEAVQALKNEGYTVLAIEQTTRKIWLQDFSPEKESRYHRAILGLTTAFWDAQLRGDKDAATWLNGSSARSVLSPKDKWEIKAKSVSDGD